MLFHYVVLVRAHLTFANILFFLMSIVNLWPTVTKELNNNNRAPEEKQTQVVLPLYVANTA